MARPPQSCVVFEDSSAGIEAASRAGCLCIALATTHSPEELQDYQTALIVFDFTTLSASGLKELRRGTVTKKMVSGYVCTNFQE
jgi:beta-phosphoglucomutase-like phosphatase (HAD superfamily)